MMPLIVVTMLGGQQRASRIDVEGALTPLLVGEVVHEIDRLLIEHVVEAT
jgi:hypothetical protein